MYVCFHGSAFGTEQTVVILHPRKDPSFHSQYSLVAWLSIVLWVEFSLLQLSPVYITMYFAIILVQLIFSSHVVKFYLHSFWHSWEIHSHCKPPLPLALTIFLDLLSQWSLTLRWGSWIVSVSIKTGFCHSTVWLIMVFCNGLYCKEISLIRGEDLIYLWAEGKIFRM